MKNKLVAWKKRETPWDTHPLDILQREVNELMDVYFQGHRQLSNPSGSESGFEISETDDGIQVKAELPGLNEKDIQISVQENMLTIRAEHREEKKENKRKYHISEIHYGHYSRTVSLPAEVDVAKAKARFKRGVLTLELPKTEQAKVMRKRIPIRVD